MKKKLFLFALLITIFVSCKNKDEKKQNEHTEEAKIQLTGYSEDFELFAEADPFVAGKPSGILSHFSHLPSFKALETGSVTIHLIIGDKDVFQKLEKPTRKGIYKFELKPETAGSGKIVYDININNKEYKLEIPNVTVYSNKETADDSAKSIVVSKTNTTVFTKEQSWKIEFATAYPDVESFGQVIKTTAQVQSTIGDEQIVISKASGIVLYSGPNILEGQNVTKGQKLFSISSSGIAENNLSVRFSEASNNYTKAKADYDRVKELVKDKIVSDKELLIAKNQYENTKAIYDNLSNNFNINGQNIVSPINGFVKQIHVKNGQYVEIGQPIATISQNKTLMLRAEVQQKYAPILGTINSATIRNLQDNQAYSLEQLNGKVLSFGQSSNNDNYLIPLNIQIDNKGSFIPGSFIELYLKTITNTQALTVPNFALIEEQGIYFVFVQINPELFEKKEVKIGATDGLKTEIINGISKTDRIVSKGAILIKLAQATGTLDAHSGHNH
jgi:RND family efflux transporter MFP subunit